MTEHFSLDEFTRTNHIGIDNNLPAHLFKQAEKTLNKLEEIRKILKHPIIITSGYRSYELNKAVRGVHSKRVSQHTEAKAVDFICPQYGPPISVALVLKDHIKNLGIDQLIYEFERWVHVSFDSKPRNDIFSIKHPGKYLYGLVV